MTGDKIQNEYIKILEYAGCIKLNHQSQKWLWQVLWQYNRIATEVYGDNKMTGVNAWKHMLFMYNMMYKYNGI